VRPTIIFAAHVGCFYCHNSPSSLGLSNFPIFPHTKTAVKICDNYVNFALIFLHLSVSVGNISTACVYPCRCAVLYLYLHLYMYLYLQRISWPAIHSIHAHTCVYFAPISARGWHVSQKSRGQVGNL